MLSNYFIKNWFNLRFQMDIRGIITFHH